MRRKNSKRRSAFTLLELLLVAGILAVLAAFAIPRLMGQAETARIDIAKASVLRNGAIAKALEAYKWAMGKYPDTDEGLAALFKTRSEMKDEERYKGPYLMGTYEELKDPWGNPFEYKSPGDMNEDSYDVWSRGPNGDDDGGKEGSDDVKNWIEK